MEAADRVLHDLRERLSIAADEALSADYGNQAKAEETTADKLRNRAVWFGIATAVAAIIAVGVQVALILDGETDSNWSLLPAKAAAIGALAALATYYGRQSTHHRSTARQYRNAQLELGNLGSYLAELDPPDRADVRRELVSAFFGKPVETVKQDDPGLRFPARKSSDASDESEAVARST